GLVFVGCAIGDAAAQSTARRAGARRTVTIRGRRVTTVDMHAHCAVPQASDLLRRTPPAPTQQQGSLLALEGQLLTDRLAALSNVIGTPLETTIALSHLIFEGTLDSPPKSAPITSSSAPTIRIRGSTRRSITCSARRA